MPRRWAWRMTSSHSAVFVFFGAMMRAHPVDQDLGAAAGKRVEPGIAQARERLGHRQLRPAGDVLHLGRREGVQVDRVARLDRAEQILVPVDAEVGVVTALHQHRGAAESQRLLDLLEDHRARQHVALAAVPRPAVEGAEVAVGDADVGVVDIAVDDERDLVAVGAAVAHLVGGAADGDEVARAQQRERVVVGETLARQHAIEDLARRSGPVRRRPPSPSAYGPCGQRSEDRGRPAIAPAAAASS